MHQGRPRPPTPLSLMFTTPRTDPLVVRSCAPSPLSRNLGRGRKKAPSPTASRVDSSHVDMSRGVERGVEASRHGLLPLESWSGMWVQRAVRLPAGVLYAWVAGQSVRYVVLHDERVAPQTCCSLASYFTSSSAPLSLHSVGCRTTSQSARAQVQCAESSQARGAAPTAQGAAPSCQTAQAAPPASPSTAPIVSDGWVSARQGVIFAPVSTRKDHVQNGTAAL